MEEIIRKYFQKLNHTSYRKDNVEVVSLDNAKLLIREALEEYKHKYKVDRRFDFWGNEIF